MLAWDDTRFRKEFRNTPIFRLKRSRWLRNICIVLGNIGAETDLPSLEQASRDKDPLVREHALWGIQQIRSRLKTEKAKI
jgi:epoxyqueuosine reductase